MAAVNNETLAAIMIVGNALFNNSSGESLDEKEQYLALNQSTRAVILS